MTAKQPAVHRRVWLRYCTAALCLMVAVGAVALGALPLDWLAPINALGALIASWTLTLGVRPLPMLVGLIPLLVAIWLLTRRAPALPVNRQGARIAPVAVYVDLENQLSESTIKAFVSYLRRQIAPRQTADLFYYADAEEAAKSARYKSLWRYGFRPVDVPHHPFGTQNVENVVDMELALHAYERALAAPTPQHIILITADQDYIPLIYRLHALGHRVSILAMELPLGLKKLGAYLGVETLEFNVAFKELETATILAASNTSAPPKHISFPAQSLAPLESAVNQTLAWLNETAQQADLAPPEQNKRFRESLGIKAKLSEIGFSGSGCTGHWLLCLKAVQVIASTPPAALPKVGVTSVPESARHIDHFLNGLLNALWQQAPDQASLTCTIAAARDRLKTRSHLQVSQFKELFRLATTGDAYIPYLLHCAATLHKIASFKMVDHDTFQIEWTAASAND